MRRFHEVPCGCYTWGWTRDELEGVQGGVMGYSLVAISMMILYALALIFREIFSKVPSPPALAVLDSAIGVSGLSRWSRVPG